MNPNKELTSDNNPVTKPITVTRELVCETRGRWWIYTHQDHTNTIICRADYEDDYGIDTIPFSFYVDKWNLKLHESPIDRLTTMEELLAVHQAGVARFERLNPPAVLPERPRFQD